MERSCGRPAQTSGATGSGAAPASFQATLQWQPRTVYFAALLNGDADNYFGPVLDAGDPVTQNLPVTHFAGGAGSSTLTVKMQGGADGAHTALVSLNGTDLGTMSFQDMASGSAAFTVLNSLLKEGDNALKLVTNGADDVSAVDTVTLTYPHSYTADGDYLRFTAQAGAAVTVGGFSGKAIEVVDITDPTNPILTPGTVAAQGSSYAVTFGAPGSGVRTLLALTQAKEAAPASIAANQSSSWKGKQAGADMVIIGHAAFLAAGPAGEAAATGAQGGGSGRGGPVRRVQLREESPYAIRSFLAAAQANWATKPAYVLLMGNGTFDPRKYLASAVPDLGAREAGGHLCAGDGLGRLVCGLQQQRGAGDGHRADSGGDRGGGEQRGQPARSPTKATRL